jgi:hypothetical protein
MKNKVLWDMPMYILIQSNEDFEENNCSLPKIRIISVLQNIPNICW